MPKPTAIATQDRLIVALDFPDAKQAQQMVDQLGSTVCFYKIGLELFMSGDGFTLLEQLLNQDKKVFVDLKFFDVPQTVAAAVRQLRNRGVSFATVHGNDAMLAAAVAEKSAHLKLLAVTALTSLDRGDLNDLGFNCDIEALVLSRAKRALAIGCDGVVASGLEAPGLKKEFADQLLIVIPGIRPVDNDDDQKRTVDVTQAFCNGADYIVIGRPITLADSPLDAAMRIADTITRFFAESAELKQTDFNYSTDSKA